MAYRLQGLTVISLAAAEATTARGILVGWAGVGRTDCPGAPKRQDEGFDLHVEDSLLEL